MPDRSTQTTINEFEALLEMVEADSVTPAGSMPPVDHIQALRENSDLHEPSAIVEAFKNNQAPPTQ